MPTALLTRIRDSGPTVWRRATWLTPVAIQPVLGMLVGVTWLLLDWLPIPYPRFRVIVLLATALTTAVTVTLGALLTTSDRPGWRAFGLSLAGSGFAVLIGNTTYALFLMWPSDARM
ncbi:hypothetical protein [Mycolicibacter minnesotensis]